MFSLKYNYVLFPLYIRAMCIYVDRRPSLILLPTFPGKLMRRFFLGSIISVEFSEKLNIPA